MRACGQKLVKFCTLTHIHTTAAKLVVRIWHADKQYNSDKNEPKWESCRHFMIVTQLKNNNNNVKSYQISVYHKSYTLK